MKRSRYNHIHIYVLSVLVVLVGFFFFGVAKAEAAITISGTLFSDEGTTQITSGKTIALAVGTSTVSVQSTSTDSGAGTYSFEVDQTYLSATSGTPFVIYVDADGSTRAALITKIASTTANITGLNLYQDTVIVRQEGATSTSLTDLAIYDSTDDSDLQYTASSTLSSLDILNGQEFHIWAGDTFSAPASTTFNGSFHNPGGVFTASTTGTTTFSGSSETISGTTTGSSALGNVEITGTYTMSNNASTTDLTIDSGGSLTAPALLTIDGDYTNNGTFTPGSGKVTLTSTSTAATLNAGSSAFNDLDINNGLLAYWKMDEGTSSSTQDWTGNGNTGTLMSNTEWSTDVNATTTYTNPSSLSFDGVDDYVELSNFDLSGTDAVTVAFWLNTAVVTAANKMLFEYSVNSGSNNAFYLNMNETLSNGNIGLMDRDSGENLRNHVNTSGVYADGEWHHVVAVIDRSLGTSQNKLYVDGVDDTVQDASWEDDIDGNFGGPYDSYIISRGGGSEFLNGSIDDFRIYNRALSAAEITDLATGYHPTTTVYTLESDLDVNGDFGNYTGFDTSASNYDVYLAGNATTTGEANHRSGTTTIDGSSAQRLVGDMIGTSQFYNLNITNTSGNGTTSRSVIFGNELTATGTFTMAASSSAEFAAGATSTFATVDWQGSVGSPIWLYSTDTGTEWFLVAAGTIDYVNVQDSNSCGSPGGGVSTDSLTSTDVANNTCWTFTTASGDTITISGTLYENDRTTAITRTATITAAVGTSTVSLHSTTTAADGSYSLSDIATSSLSSTTPIVIFVDENATTSSSTATTITYAIDNATDSTILNGIDLYADTVHLINATGSQSIFLASSTDRFYDSDNDFDILFTATTSTTTIKADVFINASTTVYAPMNFIIDGDFTNNGTFEAGSGEVVADATSFDILSARLTGLSTVDAATPRGITFKPDGMELYVANQGGGSEIMQYNLSIPFDVTTSVYDTATDTVSSAYAVALKPDGTQMFVNSLTAVDSYDLSTPWDVSTASYVTSTTTTGASNSGLAFKPDGTKMFVADGSTQRVYEFGLSTPWDVSTSFNVDDISLGDNSTAFVMFDDGSGAITLGRDDEILRKYELTTPWDVSTLSYLNIDFDIEDDLGNGQGMAVSPDGTKIFFTNSKAGDDDLFEYTLDQPQTFTGTFTATSSLYDFTVGDTATVSPAYPMEVDHNYQNNGSAAGPNAGLIELTGTSTLSGDGNFGFVEVQGSASSTDASITFTDLTIAAGGEFFAPENIYITGDYDNQGTFNHDSGTLTFSGQGTFNTDVSHVYSVSTGDSKSRGLFMSPDGLKLYLAADNVDVIQQFSLSTAWDLSTASSELSTSTAAYGGDLYDLFISPNGEDMYTVDPATDLVVRYSLSTAWDVSTASFVATTSVTADTTKAVGIAFSSDGMTMILANEQGSGELNQYTLSTAWDVTTATYDTNYDTSAQGEAPQGLTFSDGGTRMYMTGYTDAVYAYSLASPYDISSITFIGDSGVLSESTATGGVIFSADGTWMYTVDGGVDSFRQYDVSARIGTSTGSTGAFHDVVFSASGTSAFTGPASTTSFTIEATATVTAPAADLTVEGDYTNNGTFTNNSGTVYFGGVGSFQNDITYTKSTSTLGQTNDPGGIVFSNDGTKMYVTGFTGDSIYQYTLSTAWDVSTASYLQSTTTASQETTPRGLYFKEDGLTLYMVGDTSNNVNQYSLSSAWDISTTDFVQSFSVNAQDTFATGLAFSKDGLKMFMVGWWNDEIYEYTLTTAWDISTAAYVDSFSVAGQETKPSGMAFSPNGQVVYIIGADNDSVFRYELSQPWDISSAAYVDSFDVAYYDDTPVSLTFSTNGDTLYVLGYDGDKVYQFEMNAEISGTLTGSSAFNNVVFADDETVFVDNASTTDLTINSGATLNGSSTVSVAGNYTNNGSFDSMYGTLVLTGTSKTLAGTMTGTSSDLNHVIVNGTYTFSDDASINDLTINAGGSLTAPATLTVGGDYTNSGTFTHNSGTVNLDQGDSFTTDISYQQSSTTATQEALPLGLIFKPDGTKMYLSGNSDFIYEYDLTTAWDISTLSYLQSKSVAAQDVIPRGMAISTDGTKLFLAGATGNDINEYTLSPAWDITSASFVDSFSVTNQETGVRDVSVSTDGLTMFVIGSNSDKVHQYSLATAWDVSTASYVKSLSVAAQESVPNGLVFNADGTKLYVVGEISVKLHEYTLSTAWDVATAKYVDEVALGAQDGVPVQFQFSSDGSQAYMLGYANDLVYEYTVTPSSGTTTGTLTGSSAFNNVSVTGSKTIIDSNASTSDLSIAANATVTAPTGALTIDGVYDNDGVFEANGGTVYLTGVPTFDNNVSYMQNQSVNQDANPYSLHFKPDGTQVFVLGYSNQLIYEYGLTTAWDISTLSLTASSSIDAETQVSRRLTMNPAGTKLYISDSTADEIDEYVLTTAWDITTLSYSTTSTAVGTPVVNPAGIDFSSDGTKLFVIDSSSHDISEFTLSTPWDVTSATYIDAFSVGQKESFPGGVTFSNDGTKFFVTGYTSSDDYSYEYRMTTAWDISTAAYYDAGYTFDNQETTPLDHTFSSNGEFFYIIGAAGDDINQYRVLGSANVENNSDFNNLVVASGTVHFVGSATTTGDFTVALNATATAPTATFSIAGNFTNNGVWQDDTGDIRLIGTSKTLSGTLTGSSDLGNVTIAGSYTFSNNASTTDLAIESGGTLTAPSQLTVDGNYTNNGTFTNSSGEVVLGAKKANLEDPVYSRRFDTSDQGTVADLLFSATGTYMYMLDSTETIHQYHLDIPWDVSTASVTPQTLSVSALDSTGGGLYFNDTGDLLFYVGSANDEVHEITLSTPWDVSSGSQTATTSVVDCCGADEPNDIWFSPGGEYMFVSFRDSIAADNIVSRYDLSTPWDISTASFGLRSGGLSSWYVQQVALAPDGLTMYVLGGSSAVDINRYVLDNPWDVSSWTYVDDFDVGHREGSETTFTFGDSFSRMYIGGNQNDYVLEYDLDPASQTATGTMTGTSAFSALTQSSNQPLTFGADASTTGTFTIASSSAINGATTTVFNAGSSYTFQNVDWQGASSTNELVFRSSASGTAWYLDIPGSQLNVEYVNVQDSDATETSGGVAASNNNTDNGNNTNWNFTATADPWNATDWTLYDTITIRHENIDEPLADFPVYVDLSDLSAQFWSTVADGGGDIRITTDEATPTELPREVVSASTTLETGELHFKADYVSEVIDTSYRIYYNGTDIEYATSDTYGAQNVWSNGYVAVWHLNEDPSVAGTDGILDSTTHNLHGTDGGSMDANDRVAGKLGGYALDFDKSDDIVEVASNPLLEGFTSITYSAWFNPDGNGSGNGDRIISKSDGANGDDYALTIDSGNTNARCRVTTSAQVNATTSDVGTNWSYGVCRYDGANILANIDYDAQTESKAQTGTIDDNNASLGIGQHPDATTRLFGGIIDEVRIASTSRSDAWIKAEYYNQSTTTDFYTLTTGGTGSSTIADHDAGQVSNAFDFQNKTNEALFAFKLTPNTGNATVTRTELAISGWNHKKLEASDFSNIRLYRDLDNDAAYDAGDTQVGGSGAISFFAPNTQYGTLVFTDDYLATTSQNYVVIADWNMPERGSHMKLSLEAGGLDMYDSAGSVEVLGTVDHVQHIRNNAGGGGSSAQVGGAPPAGDGDVGGGTNEGGEQIGSDPDFKWPSANSGSWTTPANAYDQTDGTYATDNAGATNNFSDHGFSVGGSNQIDGIIVKLEISGTTAAGDIGVELSWDGGTSWTSSQSTPTLTTTDAVVSVGGSGDTWGRSWTPSEFSNANFVVRLTGNPSSNTVQVDAIQVRVFHSTTGGGAGGGGGI